MPGDRECVKHYQGKGAQAMKLTWLGLIPGSVARGTQEYCYPRTPWMGCWSMAGLPQRVCCHYSLAHLGEGWWCSKISWLLNKGAIQVIPGWLSFHIHVFLGICLHETKMTFRYHTSHSRKSSFWFSIQMEFSFWYGILVACKQKMNLVLNWKLQTV